MKKERNMKKNHIWFVTFYIFVILISGCEANNSSSSVVSDDVISSATASAEVNSITYKIINRNIILSWTVPTLTPSHKKKDGKALTKADISYKVYRVVKGSDARTVAQIKTADRTPLAVAKGITSTSINNLTGSTVYEIVVQAVNATDPTKASIGKRIEVTTDNPATAPAEVRSVIGNPIDISVRIEWQEPVLTSSHKKANGQRLTAADVSYKVYRVAKGSDARTIAQIKEADTNPLLVAKGTIITTVTNLKPATTYEIVVQAVNSTDTAKVSTGIRIEVTTLANNHATAPPDARSVRGSPTDDNVEVSWQEPALTSSHKKANGQRLTTADVSYKVYRVVKGSDARTVAQIKTADTTPLSVAKGTTSTSINNLTGSTAYEIVVQAVNSTDTAKVSTGIRVEVTTANFATAPADARSVRGSPTDDSVEVSWQEPTLTNSHKKANGQRLTKSDVSYKVYRIAKGRNARTVAQIKETDTNPLSVVKETTSTSITNLTGSTTYEIVVQAVNATDTTKASTGIRIEVTTTNPATAPADARSVRGSPTDDSVEVSWQAPALTSSHKKANGQKLTTTDVSYKVYRIAKGRNARTVAQIKEADTNPLAVAKGTTSITINNLTESNTYEIVVQAINATDTTKISTGIRIEVTTLATNHATAPAEVSSITIDTFTDTSANISWQEPTLTNSHKKANGQRLTETDVSYKVYRVAKGVNARTIAQIKEADANPLTVAKGTTSTSITHLKPTTTYEIVVQAVNATDTTKVSTGIKAEVATDNPATAPAEVGSVTGSPTDTSVGVSWQEPTLTNSHKKANGQRLTKADVSYKVYRVAKGRNARTIAQIKEADSNPLTVAKGTTSTNINNLKPNTTYEIVVQAVNFTDPTKASTGIKAEVTTTSSATDPADVRNVIGNFLDIIAIISWKAPTLNDSHKKANGQKLTTADVSYKVYRVAKGRNARKIAQIKTADTNPLTVAKGTTSITINNLKHNTTYEIVVQAVNATDTTKVSTGVRIQGTTQSFATAPSNVNRATAESNTDTSVRVSWSAPLLLSAHKKADGTRLTAADVSYIVYYLPRGRNPRTIAEIIRADKFPLTVAKGTTSAIMNYLTEGRTYEIVVQAINATDTTKVSTGIRIEVNTVYVSTPPADARSVTGRNPTDISVGISWQEPALNNSHKKANGQRLTAADVSYKVYRVAKGRYARTIAQIKEADRKPLSVAKGTTSITITRLKPTTTYEIVVQAVNSTHTQKVSTGIRIEVTTLRTLNFIYKERGTNYKFTSKTMKLHVGITLLPEITPNVSGTYSISPNIYYVTGGMDLNTRSGTISGYSRHVIDRVFTVTFTARDGRRAETEFEISVER